MIKISRIHIRRFRSIMDLELNVRADNNFVTICGENNSGKTNTLRALNIFFHPELYIYEKDTPFHKLEGSQGALVYPQIIIEFIEGEKRISIERNFDKDNCNTSGKEIDNTDTVPWNEKQCQTFLNKINFFYIESINVSYPKLINNLIDTVFEVAFSNVRFSGAKKDLKEAYEKYIEGLLGILQSLSNEINPLFKEYRENWQVEFILDSDIKNFRDIITNDIEFYINDSSNKHIESKGSGLQRLAYILLHFRIIEKLNKNSILLVDEPDIFLHQSLQKTLYKHFQQIKEKAQIFITTHSPVFIESYTLNNVFLLDLEITEKFYKRRNRNFNELKTKLVDISGINGDHKIKKYLGIDNKDFDLLGKYNIIVEGESDLIYLTELCKYFNFTMPFFSPLGGADNAERTLQFYNNFYHEQGIKPNIIVLLDNDSKGREVYKKILAKKPQYPNLRLEVKYIPNFIGNKDDISSKNNEIEDFVYPELIVELCNKILSKKSLIKLGTKQISEKICKPAFINRGILELLENEKNEKNPDEGQKISLISENVKNSMAKLLNIEGNSKIIKIIEECDLKYPNVKLFLKELCQEW